MMSTEHELEHETITPSVLYSSDFSSNVPYDSPDFHDPAQAPSLSDSNATDDSVPPQPSNLSTTSSCVSFVPSNALYLSLFFILFSFKFI
ncbi:unnamed protein product [Rodentolepis nana]|uniref:CTNNB1 binding N-teminal domain-containing protein n=1 Tax=Rodentolepis nana TaxID=102285 RepID=A0A0R3TDZ5_RODNA|nr:unnamed protein product [Rodentolepis nana]